MKFLIFLLFTLPSFAQKTFIIVDEHNAPISGASVFLARDKNELVAISDEKGIITLILEENSQYKVHSLGFIDTNFSTAQLNQLSTLVIKTSSYQLKEVKAGLLKDFLIKKDILQKRYIVDAPQDANKQRVIQINIDTPGYLKSLKLFCKIQVKEVVPDYRFILLAEKDQKPDSLLIPLSIEGKKNKKEIIFDLSKTNYFLEKGTYFIGYETFNGKAIINKQVHYDKNQRKIVIIPIVLFCSNDNQLSYESQNLSKWYIPKIGEIGTEGKMIWSDDYRKNFAYELTLAH